MQDSPNNNLRVALYCRVSTEEQREGQTIESQVAELERFAREKHWAITGIYKDEGWSGSLLARPELDRLRDDATKGLFDAVLINDVDRLARDVTHLGVIKRDLERHSIRVIFKKLPGEQSPTQNLLVNILGSFAEFERELISDRTRRGKRHKVEVRKQFLGSIPPYGFSYVPKGRSNSVTGSLEIVPGEATVVRQIYRWVDEGGLSSLKVVSKLNESGIPPRKGGPLWQTSSVRRILRSEVYAGVWHYNKHQLCEPRRPVQDRRYRKSPRSSSRLRPRTDWLPVVLPPNLRIVDSGVWRRVQEQLNRNTSFSTRNAKHFYLLAGLIQCGGCEGAYVGDPSHGRFAYRCSQRCKAYGMIRETDLDSTVWSAMSEALQAPNIIVQATTEIDERAKATAHEEARKDEISQSLEQIQREELRLLQAYRLEILSPEQLAQQLQALKARRANARSKLNASSKPGKSVVRRSVEEYCQTMRGRLESLNSEKRQRVLRLLLKRIVFEGTQVRIIGRIPITSGSQEVPGSVSACKAPEHGCIAATTSLYCARNAARYHKNFELWGHDPSATITFEFLRQIEKDTTIARVANAANLAKANAALKKKRDADEPGVI